MNKLTIVTELDHSKGVNKYMITRCLWSSLTTESLFMYSKISFNATRVSQHPLPTVIYCHQVGHQYKWIRQHTCKKLSKSWKERSTKVKHVRMRAIAQPCQTKQPSIDTLAIRLHWLIHFLFYLPDTHKNIYVPSKTPLSNLLFQLAFSKTKVVLCFLLLYC